MVRASTALAIDGAHSMLERLQLFEFDSASVAAIPIMVFAYACHVPSVPVFYELTADPSLFGCSKWRRAAEHPPIQQSPQPLQQPHLLHNSEMGTSNSASAVSQEPLTADQPLGESHVARRQSNPTSPLLSRRMHEGHAQEHDGASGLQHALRRKLAGMSRVCVAAYAECSLLYVCAGLAGYLLFPNTAEANILNNFSNKDPLMQLMRVCIGVAVLLHYPINSHLARSALYDLLCRACGVAPCMHAP